MKKKIAFIILTLIVLIPSYNVHANIICNDGTISSVCGDCHKGCCSRHGGCTAGAANNTQNSDNTGYSPGLNANSNVSTNNGNTQINNSNQNNATRNSDTSLKEIKINDQSIPITDDMKLTINTKEIIVSVIANNSKTVLEYEKSKTLNNGDNIYTIKATAENGNVKEYQIKITVYIPSSNKKFKIYNDDKELKIDTKSKTIESITTNSESVNLKYKAEDSKTTITVEGNNNLKDGDNYIKVKVAAEDKSEDDYTLKITRESPSSPIVGLLLFIILIVIIVFITRKGKESEIKNKNIALLLCVFGGGAGLHQFYTGNIAKGIIYMFTCGLFLIGWLIDLIKLLKGTFKDNNGMLLK